MEKNYIRTKQEKASHDAFLEYQEHVEEQTNRAKLLIEQASEEDPYQFTLSSMAIVDWESVINHAQKHDVELVIVPDNQGSNE